MKVPVKEAEERLLVEAAQRDPACFAELCKRHFERVYAYIARTQNEYIAPTQRQPGQARKETEVFEGS